MKPGDLVRFKHSNYIYLFLGLKDKMYMFLHSAHGRMRLHCETIDLLRSYDQLEVNDETW